MKNRSKFSLILSLLKMARPLVGVLLITVTAGVLGFLASIGISYLAGLGLLIYLGELEESYSKIFYLAITFAVLRGILRYFEQYSGHYLAFKVLAMIRDKVFTALRKLAPAKLECKEKGNLIAIITSDIELLEVFFAHTIAPVLIALITGLIVLSFAYYYSPISSLIIFVGYLFVAFFIPKYITRLGEKDGEEFRKGFGKLSSFVMESLKGIRESMQFSSCKERMEGLERLTEKTEAINKRLKYYEELTKALCDLVIMLTALLVFFVNLYLYDKDQARLSAIIMPLILSLSSFGPLIAISNLSNNLLQTFSSGHRVLDLLEEKPIVEENIDGQDLTYGNIDIDKLNFSYGQKKILDDINMKIDKNKVYGILGQSGCGKSTLLKLIMRFWKADSGRIKIGDKDIEEVKTKDLRSLESYVTQETFLFKGTIAENISIAKEGASMDEIIGAAKKASIHDFISKLPDGYQTQIGEISSSLSAGEKQRLSMARAFLHGGPIMLLDEPTSNLDSLNEAVILKSIREESVGKTVILVSHRKSTLGVSDRIYSFKDKKYID